MVYSVKIKYAMYKQQAECVLVVVFIDDDKNCVLYVCVNKMSYCKF